MARGKTFGQVVDATKAEAGHSLNAAAGRNVSEHVETLVRRVYERLHGDYEWPHLILHRDITLSAGQRFYSFPDDLDPDRTGRVWTLEDGTNTWTDVCYGIDQPQWNTYNPERDERADPVRSWQRYNAEDDHLMVEVWPLPQTSGGLLRLEGMPYPRPLVERSDIVDLDDQLVSLQAAAELLMRQQSPDAEAKMKMAEARYKSLRSQQQTSDPFFSMHTKDPRGRNWTGVRVRAPRS